MLLQFLRHADAEPFADSDFTRNLTPKGLKQAEKVGNFIKSAGLVPEVIFTSPLVRARETADIVGKAIGIKPEIMDCLACGMDLDTLLTELRPHATKTSILVVGHEPDFSHSISRFLGITNPFLIHIRKASLTGVEVFDWDIPEGRLQFSVPASLM